MCVELCAFTSVFFHLITILSCSQSVCSANTYCYYYTILNIIIIIISSQMQLVKGMTKVEGSIQVKKNKQSEL